MLSDVNFSKDNSSDDDCSENGSLMHRPTVEGVTIDKWFFQIRNPKPVTDPDPKRQICRDGRCSTESTVTHRIAVFNYGKDPFLLTRTPIFDIPRGWGQREAAALNIYHFLVRTLSYPHGQMHRSP